MGSTVKTVTGVQRAVCVCVSSPLVRLKSAAFLRLGGYGLNVAQRWIIW